MKRIMLLAACLSLSALVGFAQTAPTVDAATAVVAPEAVETAPFTAEDARASVQQAIDLLVEVNTELTNVYFHDGAWDDCVSVLDRMTLLFPAEIDYYANAAWLLWSTQQIERAMSYYAKMIEHNPINPEAYYTVAHYYFFTRQDYATALTYLEQMMQYHAPMLQRHLYAHCLEKLGRTQEALAAWQQMLADEPHDDVAQRAIERLTTPMPSVDEQTP